MNTESASSGKMNLPASKLPFKKTEEELLSSNIQWQVFRILAEFIDGFDFISKYQRSVTIFGSARSKSDDSNYKLARELGRRIAGMGYAVVTGGGPGIMEAANRGARDEQKSRRTTRRKTKGVGPSVGLNIQLPKEQRINPFVNESMAFRFFFSRKVMLSFAAEAYIYLPGGFGTMDEFFELLTLVQTHKINKVPIILIGREYWESLAACIKNHMDGKYIDHEDTELYQLVDTADEAIEIIKKAPIREFSTTKLSK